MDLDDDDQDSQATAQGNGALGKGVSFPVVQGAAVATSTRTVTPRRSGVETPIQRPEMMPPFDSRFWKTYGNKLRVFGTVEGLCDLSDS